MEQLSNNYHLLDPLVEPTIEEAILEELLIEHQATEEEAKVVRAIVSKTGNPWDVELTLSIIRIAGKNSENGQADI